MSSVSNGLYFLTLPLVSVMRVIYRKIRHARYLYIKRYVEKVWGARYTLSARYLSKNTVSNNQYGPLDHKNQMTGHYSFTFSSSSSTKYHYPSTLFPNHIDSFVPSCHNFWTPAAAGIEYWNSHPFTIGNFHSVTTVEMATSEALLHPRKIRSSTRATLTSTVVVLDLFRPLPQSLTSHTLTVPSPNTSVNGHCEF